MSRHGFDNMPASTAQERGSGLLMVLIVVMISAVISISAATRATSELEITANYRSGSRAFYAADGAARAAFADLVELSRQLGRFPTTGELAAITPVSFTSVSFPTFDIVVDGAAVTQTLDSGYFQGLVATSQSYAVTVDARADDFSAGTATVAMSATVDLIPIFQFAAFYNHILEIYPGPDMLLSGRVHSNSDIYVRAWNSFTVDSALTSAADIYNRRLHDAQLPGGQVKIRDGLGNFPAMNGLDSTDPDWHDDALSRWNGNVRSQAHGIEPVNLAIPMPGSPRTLIEPGFASDGSDEEEAKLFYQAGLRILNGQGFDANGDPVSLMVGGDSALRNTVIYDAREGKEILTIEIDVDVLGDTPGYPANGVVYVASLQPGDGIPAWAGMPAEWVPYGMPYDGNNTEFGVKLTNGSRLPGPLSFISENTVYVRGDYNDTAKKPAAVMADSIYILSNEWGRKDIDGDPVPSAQPDDDLGYGLLDMDSRIPSDTTVQSSFMLGSRVSTWGSYQGGLENVPRMLEKWTGVDFIWRGSFISLWNPVHNDGDWAYGAPVYKPPTRDWGFDSDLLDPNNFPPATPMLHSLRITGWTRR